MESKTNYYMICKVSEYKNKNTLKVKIFLSTLRLTLFFFRDTLK